ncbi:MAG: 2-oxoglutarate dehydrogenase E1 component [Methylicorpusculum sp.]|uniref:2-oxoglutarate dehydrogenase E1 component n=1 Tax=Methylicorpusculum sp. TaxID=2713644 RepID=UPI002723BF7B|nr:2-oxoglutarate dehydrogenase E1 component [Methylicorpusculum sp.]MDO8845828.1 2-oxoglutarate dehydrogenase E1 component [Methylicorpusculum sp.]MDO8939230.1 2-oxoglutarate dehydrogenase E1 component [Methylicorpusculum sp.]MDP2201726.1 2-oxoglutarate dehydrogenase E1 component [Methylicorpusculum sp.]
MSDLLKLFRESSSLYGSNANFIEELYEQYLQDPDSVEDSWKQKFGHIRSDSVQETAHSPIIERFASLAQQSQGRLAKLQGFTEQSVKKQSAVARLINHYRVRGHQIATNNPLHTTTPYFPDLDPAYYGLTELDMDTLFDTGTLYGVDRLPLRDIISTLKEIYCGNIGTEYMHIVDTDMKRWIKNRLEGAKIHHKLSAEEQMSTLLFLTAAEGIEKYLHNTFVGQKRFSLEGGESLIPILDNILQRAGEKQTKEVVIGMAHRGRLNVLVNILGKNPSKLFEEFKGIHIPAPGMNSGDVKYHMGFSSDIVTPGGPIHVTLAFNPSHLEIINPVVEGSVRARQDRDPRADSHNTILPILIHGDAAFAGQGVVMETLNMAGTRGFSTGGTVHIVVNNQIGFTTSNPADARSTLYCTDVANMVQIPVFHVNGDDPEAVLFVAKMALDFRMTFNKDVVIDLICYRRLGHNEADEPATTQPLMYKYIRNRPTTRHIFANKLIEAGVISKEDAIQLEQDYVRKLESGQVVSRPIANEKVYSYSAIWDKYLNKKWTQACKTAVSLDVIRFCNKQLQILPTGFELHPRVGKIMDSRRKMAAGALPLDWGFAENLAYATLAMEKYNVRLTGQDVGRGTFFHRHAVLHNQIDGSTYQPLSHLDPNQGRVQIYDSLLSEEAVLGFEYGYSSTTPDCLVIWEAQFGDFANGAQVVIDQFITSGETKWGRLSGLVMLLPHGYEGQGPEHSSARLERYMQLCAEHNIQVCTPTTPAQIFHLLRRQMIRTYRKPLIIMSPKSLLRHKLAVSTLEDLSKGKFQTIISETDSINPKNVKRMVLCAGKVYFDLLETRRETHTDDVAIVRIEQLYPFPDKRFKDEIAKYPNLELMIWCQEEPKNQGAWYQIRHHFVDTLATQINLQYAGRAASASPAVGNFKKHLEQQKQVVESALFGNYKGK